MLSTPPLPGMCKLRLSFLPPEDCLRGGPCYLPHHHPLGTEYEGEVRERRGRLGRGGRDRIIMNGTEGKGREGEKRRDGLIVTGEEWRRREGGIEIEG